MLVSDPEEAARLLRKGLVGAIPTETAYGLAAALDEKKALRRIFTIKKRAIEKPLLLLISAPEMLGLLTPLPLSRQAEVLIERFWPGPLTLLLPAKKGLPFEVTGHTGKVGVRISSNPLAKRLVERAGIPITATSANLSGGPLCYSPKEVMEQLLQEPPDFILDGGEIPPSPPSTIIDCMAPKPVLVREGAITQEELLKAGIQAEPLKGPA